MEVIRRWTPSARAALLALVGLVALTGACSKDKAGAAPADKAAAGTPGTAATDKAGAAAPAGEQAFYLPLTAGLTKAGFSIDAFEQAAARPYQAQLCARGEVDKLDVLLCRYGSGDEADKARKALETFIAGSVTGAVRNAGAVALAVSDRKKVDLQGKRINELLKAFAKLAAGS